MGSDPFANGGVLEEDPDPDEQSIREALSGISGPLEDSPLVHLGRIASVKDDAFGALASLLTGLPASHHAL